MKKLIVILLIIAFLCSGCSSSDFKLLSKADYVVITWDGDSKARVNGMTDEIYSNLTSLELEETDYAEAAFYTLEFYSEADRLVFSLDISESCLLSFGGKSYEIIDGSFSTGWISAVINKSAGPPDAG